MKRFGSLYSLILVMTIAFLGSCQKDEITSEQEYTQFVDFGAELEDIDTSSLIDLETGKEEQGEELRMAILNREEGGVNKGVRFDFTVGEEVYVELFFKQTIGNTIRRAHVQTKATVSRNDAGKFQLKKAAIGVPSTINLSQGGVTVSGAIGVNNGRVENNAFKVDVPRPGHLMRKQSYVVPMYFTEADVIHAGTKYTFGSTFKFYGAIVGIPVVNPHRTKFTVRELEILTNVFDTEGTMDLSELDEDGPLWDTNQDSSTPKFVELSTPEGGYSVPAKANGVDGKRWYFFWVKPGDPKINGDTKVSVGMKSFVTTNKPAYLDGGLPELSFDVAVNKKLQNLLVHRTPSVTVPLPGELIITEVFRGAREYNVAIELYNSSDHDIDLANYRMHSHSPNGEGGQYDYYSDLLQANVPAPGFGSLTGTDRRCVVLFDRSRGLNAPDKGLESRDIQDFDIKSGHYTLKPGKMAVFVEQGVKYTRAIVSKRPDISFVFNIGSPNYRGFHPYARGGYLELIRKGRRGGPRQPTIPEEVVDVFLKFDTTHDPDAGKADVWSYTMMRKPDRNTPRKTMQQGRNSDWVGRDRTEDIDWGYRFGYTQSALGNENISWFDGTEYRNGYAQARKMHNLSTDPRHAGFLRSWQIDADAVYNIPLWWQKPIAH